MVRIKRGNIARKRRKKILKFASGYRGAHSSLFRVANQQVMKALKYSYINRKQKKRIFRRIWIIRINAASRFQGITYSRLINKLSISIIEDFQKYTFENKINYIKEILNKIKDLNVKIIFEPGRALVGNAGVLLSKVEYLKQNDIKHFAIIDAAMNDLMRPTLYDAYHEIKVVHEHEAKLQVFDIVGPVCESGDFIAKNRSASFAISNSN